MVMVGLRDRDRLERASNYVIWKARMSFPLYEHGLKSYVENVVEVPQGVDQLKDYRMLILHVSRNNISKEMWNSLSTLY